jgi:quaternary ammonium compound-resistance protein SugE
LGAAGAVTIGMIWLDEAVSTLKLVSVGLVLAGVIGLQLSGAAH